MDIALESYKGFRTWYVGKLGGGDVERILLKKGESGSFVVRESGTVAGALTLVTRNGNTIRNDRVAFEADGRCYVEGAQHRHSNIVNLIDSVSEVAAHPSAHLFGMKQLPEPPIQHQMSFRGGPSPRKSSKSGADTETSTGVSNHGTPANSKDGQWSTSKGGRRGAIRKEKTHGKFANPFRSLFTRKKKRASKVVKDLGSIGLTLQIISTENRSARTYRLSVQVTSGRQLISKDVNGFSDPYTKLWLTPGHIDTFEKKGKVHHKTLNPDFNEQHTFTLTQEDLASEADGGSKLNLEIWDHDALKHDDFMGCMTFSLHELTIFASGVPLRGWFKVLSKEEGAAGFEPVVHRSPEHQPIQTPTMRYNVTTRLLEPIRVLKSEEPAAGPGKKGDSVQNYNMLKVLGRGSYGKVLLVESKWHQSDQYAMKVLKKWQCIASNDVANTMAEREVLTMGDISGCPFLTTMFSSFQDESNLYMVLELITGGDLMFHLTTFKHFRISWAAFYAGELLLALWFLHKNGIIYRDLKLDNCMVTHSGHIKLADFGMCKLQMGPGANTVYTKTFCGTPDYVAPELVQRLPYNNSIDFWCLGVFVYEMITGQAPFFGSSHDGLWKMIVSEDPFYRTSTWDLPSREFVKGLLTKNPEERLGCAHASQAANIKAIKAHPFFKSIESWEKLEALQVTPPFKPNSKEQRGGAKVWDNFDTEFTSMRPQITPIDHDHQVAPGDDTFHAFTYQAPSLAAKSGYNTQKPAEGRLDANTMAMISPR